jgi:tryptophanase
MAQYPFEPFRIKAVESLHFMRPEKRLQAIERAGYNMFGLRAEEILIDLLTDSGFTAMSDRQWAGLMVGDESYAGCKNFFNLAEAVKDIFGMPRFVPVHQGRGAEGILFDLLLQPGQIVPGNMHFATTKSHIEVRQGIPKDLAIDEAYDVEDPGPFKGNVNLAKLKACIEGAGPENVPLVLITITSNNNGGQPVSMANLRETSILAHSYGIPLFLDAARYAENAYFIKLRETGYRGKSPTEIAREMFSYADGFVMSAKKDGLVNIGGLFGMRDEALYDQACRQLILREGYTTYGGLAGRDLEALAIGLYEGIDESYLAYRIGQVQYLGDRLSEGGVPIVKPIGGHAVYLDAHRFLPHIPSSEFPGAALAAWLYVDAGIRADEWRLAHCESDAEAGRYRYPPLDLVRLAIPRRVFTQSHLDYVANAVICVFDRRDAISGLRLVSQSSLLPHFTARLEPVDRESWLR